MKVITRYGNTLNLLIIHVVSAAFCRLPDSVCVFQIATWYLRPSKRNLEVTLGAARLQVLDLCVEGGGRGEAKVVRVGAPPCHPSAATALIMQQSLNEA